MIEASSISIMPQSVQVECELPSIGAYCWVDLLKKTDFFYHAYQEEKSIFVHARDLSEGFWWNLIKVLDKVNSVLSIKNIRATWYL